MSVRVAVGGCKMERERVLSNFLPNTNNQKSEQGGSLV